MLQISFKTVRSDLAFSFTAKLFDNCSSQQLIIIQYYSVCYCGLCNIHIGASGSIHAKAAGVPVITVIS